MKLLITSVAAALISTAAVAEQSDRYNDLRLDTSKTAERLQTTQTAVNTLHGAARTQTAAQNTKATTVTFSSRNKTGTIGEGFPYGGFGPGNDSR